jgi:hypothetical protein
MSVPTTREVAAAIDLTLECLAHFNTLRNTSEMQLACKLLAKIKSDDKLMKTVQKVLA